MIGYVLLKFPSIFLEVNSNTTVPYECNSVKISRHEGKAMERYAIVVILGFDMFSPVMFSVSLKSMNYNFIDHDVL